MTRGALVLDAAIIDLDGTLVDTLGDFVAALDATLDDLGLPRVSRADIGRMVGKGSEHLIRSVLAHVCASAQRYDDAWAAYQRHYLALNGQASAVYPGAAEALAALRARGLRLACLTNKPGAFARPLLAQKGLLNAFDHLFGGDAFEKKKPDPLPVLGTCAALGSAPARTLVIGDSRNDGEAARAAGCPVVLVRWGYNHAEPIESAPHDGLLSCWADLSRWLDGRAALP